MRPVAQSVVTTARDLYTASNPPQIVHGRNLFSFSERRNNDRTTKGVIVTSFDPVSGESLEAAFNPSFLLDGLGALVSPLARFAFTAPGKPAVLSGQAGDGWVDDTYRYLLMPVRVGADTP